MSAILGDYVNCSFRAVGCRRHLQKGYDRLPAGARVSGEGCAPEIPVVSRRESMMIELTKTYGVSLVGYISQISELFSYVTE